MQPLPLYGPLLIHQVKTIYKIGAHTSSPTATRKKRVNGLNFEPMSVWVWGYKGLVGLGIWCLETGVDLFGGT